MEIKAQNTRSAKHKRACRRRQDRRAAADQHTSHSCRCPPCSTGGRRCSPACGRRRRHSRRRPARGCRCTCPRTCRDTRGSQRRSCTSRCWRCRSSHRCNCRRSCRRRRCVRGAAIGWQRCKEVAWSRRSQRTTTKEARSREQPRTGYASACLLEPPYQSEPQVHFFFSASAIVRWRGSYGERGGGGKKTNGQRFLLT